MHSDLSATVLRVFSAFLAEQGYPRKVKNVPADGDCLFHSLAALLGVDARQLMVASLAYLRVFGNQLQTAQGSELRIFLVFY
jgi:hypothetical protein